MPDEKPTLRSVRSRYEHAIGETVGGEGERGGQTRTGVGYISEMDPGKMRASDHRLTRQDARP
jgi:hypothetical protein